MYPSSHLSVSYLRYIQNGKKKKKKNRKSDSKIFINIELVYSIQNSSYILAYAYFNGRGRKHSLLHIPVACLTILNSRANTCLNGTFQIRFSKYQTKILIKHIHSYHKLSVNPQRFPRKFTEQENIGY
jgi:hypothetical protein